jgi:pentatricopeptide repeat protein
VKKKATERDIYDRLVSLAESSKFDEFLKVLEYSPPLSIPFCIKLLNQNYSVDLSTETSIKEKILEIIWKNGLYSFSSILPIMSLYGKGGQSTKAFSLYLKMVDVGIQRNTHFFNLLIRCHKSDSNAIDTLLHQMVLEGFIPDVNTYFWAIQSYSGDSDKVETLYLKMIRDRIEPNLSVYNSIINTYSICARFDKAIEIYSQMIANEAKCNDVLYASVITAYSRIGDIEGLYSFIHNYRRSIEGVHEVVEGGDQDESLPIPIINKCVFVRGRLGGC